MLSNVPAVVFALKFALFSRYCPCKKKNTRYFQPVSFLQTLILKNEEQPSKKKLQSNVSQMKQSPHAKIQAFSRQFVFIPSYLAWFEINLKRTSSKMDQYLPLKTHLNLLK